MTRLKYKLFKNLSLVNNLLFDDNGQNGYESYLYFKYF